MGCCMGCRNGLDVSEGRKSLVRAGIWTKDRTSPSQIAVPTTLHWLPWIQKTQDIINFNLTSTSILYLYIRLGLVSSLFPSGLFNKILWAFLNFSMWKTNWNLKTNSFRFFSFFTRKMTKSKLAKASANRAQGANKVGLEILIRNVRQWIDSLLWILPAAIHPTDLSHSWWSCSTSNRVCKVTATPVWCSTLHEKLSTERLINRQGLCRWPRDSNE